MGCEYGVRIKILEAASLYEVNTGVRDFLDYNTSMLDNSLFLDFLKDNGMKIINDASSKDIVCVAFSYGTRSFEEELKHIDKLLESADSKEREDKLKQIKDKVLQNKHKYIKKNKAELREEFYKNGCNITYITKKANGEIKRTETIHYRMLYRSTGKAKKGSCMFIRDSLYRKAKKFLQMGIKIPNTNTPIVELSAYMPLVTSTIIDKIKIAPENILIIKDIESYFKTNVVSVEVDENKHLIAKYINDYNVANVLFDGQALIDCSIFPKWGNGYVLLRHHFCKMAAFKSNIQQFFKDYFKDDYENAKVVDMFGNVHIAKDIKLITTDNAMKWLKLGVDYSYWCDRVRENGSYFGVVKTAHKSKLGEVQRMSYQMVNTLNIDKMAEVTKVSVEYIQSLKNNDEVFLDYLRKNVNFVNDFDVLVALVEQNPKFIKSEYFKDRRKQIIKKYVRKFRLGRIIQNGENLTIVGSPYAMLLSSVGESIDKDDTFTKEAGCIQCYTKRFKDGEYLAEFRSPFNARNNMGYLHNIYSKNIQKYFDLGCECIAINMIGTDFQARNNG